MDLLDDRVMAVELVGDDIEIGGVDSGEEGMKSPDVEQFVLALVRLRPQVGIRRTPTRPGTRWAFFFEAIAVLMGEVRRTVTETSAPPRSAAEMVGYP